MHQFLLFITENVRLLLLDSSTCSSTPTEWHYTLYDGVETSLHFLPPASQRAGAPWKPRAHYVRPAERWPSGEIRVLEASFAVQEATSGAGDLGAQRECTQWARLESHHYRDDGDRGRLGRVEFQSVGIPRPVVLLQLLHALSEQVHPIPAGGRAKCTGWVVGTSVEFLYAWMKLLSALFWITKTTALCRYSVLMSSFFYLCTRAVKAGRA